MAELTKTDREIISRAKVAYAEGEGRAIHMARYHVKNLLRIIQKLSRKPR